MRISVDTERCQGSGMCVITAEDVFDQSEDDGTVVVLRPDPPEDAWDAVREAAELCPAAAITLAGGG